MHQRERQRGGERPGDTLTFKEAKALPGNRDKKDMTLRRALTPVRVGVWLPAGERRWRHLYDAAAVREIASAFEEGRENRYLPRPAQRSRPERARSNVPSGLPDGWATSDQIQRALHDHGIDGTLFDPRWIRTRLQALQAPSQRRLVGRLIQRAFPLAQAIEKLKEDHLVMDRMKGYRTIRSQ